MIKKKKKQSYKYINLPKAVSRRANWIYLFIYSGGGLIAGQKDVHSRTPEIMTTDVPKRETPLRR